MRLAGFTASRNISGVPYTAFTFTLNDLNDFDGFVTGGAIGGDACIGLYLYKIYPDKQHWVVVPDNRSQVYQWWHKEDTMNVNQVLMPGGSSYKDRNQEIVNRSHVLFGFPEYPELDPRSRRSGTWQTIRLAKKAMIQYYVEILRDE